jgi:hypothetical protein
MCYLLTCPVDVLYSTGAFGSGFEFRIYGLDSHTYFYSLFQLFLKTNRPREQHHSVRDTPSLTPPAVGAASRRTTFKKPLALRVDTPVRK